ncbi:MAG: hypothetical protein WKF75_03145 [Singulisphaera sp.]
MLGRPKPARCTSIARQAGMSRARVRAVRVPRCGRRSASVLVGRERRQLDDVSPRLEHRADGAARLQLVPQARGETFARCRRRKRTML